MKRDLQPLVRFILDRAAARRIDNQEWMTIHRTWSNGKILTVLGCSRAKTKLGASRVVLCQVRAESHGRNIIKSAIVESLISGVPNYTLLDQLTDHQLIADIMIEAGEAWVKGKGQEGREEWLQISKKITEHCPKLRRVLRRMKTDQGNGEARFEPNYPAPATRDLDPIAEIDRLLKEANMTWTFDSGRNYTHPCTFCGTTTEARELTKIGTYYNGETISRPVCNECCSANVGRIIQEKKSP